MHHHDEAKAQTSKAPVGGTRGFSRRSLSREESVHACCRFKLTHQRSRVSDCDHEGKGFLRDISGESMIPVTLTSDAGHGGPQAPGAIVVTVFSEPGSTRRPVAGDGLSHCE